MYGAMREFDGKTVDAKGATHEASAEDGEEAAPAAAPALELNHSC